jgi:hypothetical protein
MFRPKLEVIEEKSTNRTKIVAGVWLFWLGSQRRVERKVRGLSGGNDNLSLQALGFVERQNRLHFLGRWFLLSSRRIWHLAQVFLGFPTQQHRIGKMQEVMRKAILASHPSFPSR